MTPKLRLAIVGAGPAGIYAADILLKTERAFDVSIDLFEQLPAPYGLVRYGVAPDHPRIKAIMTSEAAAERPNLAQTIAFESDMSAEAATSIIAAGAVEKPKAQTPPLAERHAATPGAACGARAPAPGSAGRIRPAPGATPLRRGGRHAGHSRCLAL